jgi:hypothetical protein
MSINSVELSPPPIVQAPPPAPPPAPLAGASDKETVTPMPVRAATPPGVGGVVDKSV